MFKQTVFFFIAVLLFSGNVFSQNPNDVLKAAWFIPAGTARSIAVGGATGALGGDLSDVYNNPAGLGFYKTREIVVSPGFLANNNKSDFRGTSSSGINKSAFQLGTSGVVIGGKSKYPGQTSAFSLSFSQLTSYNNHIAYKGLNNYSSYSEQYLEQLSGDQATEQQALNNYPFGSSLAFYTYLVDSIADAGGNVAGYRSLVPVADGIMQQYNEDDKGGLYEVSLGFASNARNKLYFGGSINVPFSSYKQDINYEESDVSGNTDNNFNFSMLSQNHSLNGVGLNGRFGIIYRTQNALRLGFAVHTPSFMSYTDKLHVSMTTDTEGYAGVLTESSSAFSGAAENVKYNEITPYKLVASASLVFKQLENVKLQKGFISADVEYINYRGSRFTQQNSNPADDPSATDYYNSLNDIVKSYYQGAFNFRLGGEFKFSPVAIRLGGAYYGSPYQDNSLKANRIMAAGGLSYRNYGFFVDLTFAEDFNKDVNFPYRLNDKANTFASLKNQRTNVFLTVGYKF